MISSRRTQGQTIEDKNSTRTSHYWELDSCDLLQVLKGKESELQYISSLIFVYNPERCFSWRIKLQWGILNMYYQQSSPETETPEQMPLRMKCEENSSTLRKK